MPSETTPKPGVARLLASWFSFTRWTFVSCVEQLRDLEDWLADKIKDGIMDVGCEPSAERVSPRPLPLVLSVTLAAALQEEVARTLERAAETVNKEPSDCWSADTEEQVHAHFAELAQACLTQALKLRAGTAEARPPEPPPDLAGWPEKYRRIFAEDARAESHRGEP